MKVTEIGFSDSTFAKADKATVRRDEDHPTSIWWVDGSKPGTTYRVQSDYDPATGNLMWVTCTCPHGLHSGGGRSLCYHACAALLSVESDYASEHGYSDWDPGETISSGWEPDTVAEARGDQ